VDLLNIFYFFKLQYLMFEFGWWCPT